MSRELPKVESYAPPHKTKHYGLLDTLRVTIPEVITLFYSYQTIIAYRDKQDGFVISANIWGNLTGRHINLLDGGEKKNRLPNDEFQQKLQEALERHCVS